MNGECPVCGGVKFRTLETIEIDKQHATYCRSNKMAAELLTKALNHTSNYQMRRCADCSLEYADPFASPGAEWYGVLYSHLKLFPGNRWEFGEVKKSIAQGQNVLDYGCGDGKFLNFISDKTSNAFGCDFSPHAIDRVKQNGFTADVLSTSGDSDLVRSRGPFDHIVAFHVLEHLDRLSSLFDLAGAVAGQHTNLWVAVPSDMRADRVFGATDPLDQPPHHLSRWSRKSLETVGLKFGWRMSGFLYEPIAWRTSLWEKSRRTSIYRKLSVGPTSERLARLVLLPFMCIAGPHALSGFSMLARFTREEV